MTSRHGHRVLVSSALAVRSVCPCGHGDIIVKGCRVVAGYGRREQPGNRAGRIRRSCHRWKNKLCSTCCARTVSPMLVCSSAGRPCSTRASTSVQLRRCIGSSENTGFAVNAGNVPATTTIIGRVWSRQHRTWCGCGIFPGFPALPRVSGCTCTRFGICGHVRPSAGASTPKRPPTSRRN